MKFLRSIILPLAAFALLLTASSLYSLPVNGASQNGQDSQAEKPAEFVYICPMHEDVKARKAGKCPKCKMKLEKKRVKAPEAAPPQK